MNSNILIGKHKGLKTHYTFKDSSGPKTAQISDSFVSVTMMPNVSQLPNSQLSIVDFPGLGERGNPIEVIKVNYINYGYLQAAKMVKFLLVFTEGALDIDNGGFKQTLENFLSFFNFSQLSSAEGRQLFSSIAFCFTSVHFRGQSHENAKNMYLQALKDAIGKLDEWHQKKSTQMPTFPIAKELVLRIVQQKRIWLFQAAVDGNSPADNKILQSLDKHNWRFINIRQKINKIAFHFNKQYQSLSPDDRMFIDENIKWRFSFGLHISTKFGQMLAKLANHFGQKQINIDEELVAINNILKELPIYENPDLQYPFKPKACTVDQRLLYIQQLDEASKKVETFEEWTEKNKQSSVSEYFTRHLAGVFGNQLAAISRLFGYSPDAIAMLNKLYANVKKMLGQAATFSRLSVAYEAEIRNRLVAQLTFGSEIGSIEQVKQKFIQYFQNNPLQIDDYNIAEVEKIIQVFAKLKEEFKEKDPTIFSKILCELQHKLAQKYRSIKDISMFVKHSYQALVEAARSHMCFAFAPLQIFESQLKKLIQLQEKILYQTLQVFDPRRHQDQIDRYNQIKSGFEDLDRKQKKPWLKSTIRTLFKNLTGFIQAGDKSKSQMLFTNKASSIFSNQAIEEIIQQYRSVMKSQINEEKLKIEAPSTHSFCSQVQFYATIKEAIKGKKVVFVLGEPLGGKSVVIEALKRKKMRLNKQGRLDLERQSRFNRINHTKTPSRLPHLSILEVLEDNEFIVEIPSYQQLPPHEKYIRMALLLDLMKSTVQFRIVMVFKETTLIHSKESKEKPFESMFCQIFNILLNTANIQAEQSQGNAKKAKPPKCAITLAVNYSKSDKPACRKILQGIVKFLQSVDEKVARYLVRIIEKNQYICEGIQNNSLFAQNLQYNKSSYFISSQLMITYGDLYAKFISQKGLFIQDVIRKIDLIKATINPLFNLASVAVNEFVQGQRPTEKSRYFKEITAKLNNPIANRYETDLRSLPDFETAVSSMDNRPYIFYRLVELRQLASSFDKGTEFSVAYRRIGRYMEHFFNIMVYLCCNNRQQYYDFMKVSTVLVNLTKELEFYQLIFMKGIDRQLEDLKENMWPREITDATTSFPDFNRQELMKKLLSRPTSWRQNDFKSSIKLLNHYISTANAVQNDVITAARIELLIFTLRLKTMSFDIDWNKGLTEQKLIEAILKDSSIKNSLPQGHRISLEKANKNHKQKENAISELQRLKRKLLA